MAVVSFATDIKVMFTQTDLRCMSAQGVALDDYNYMSDPTPDGDYPDHANARHVYGRLTGDETPRMPHGEPFWGQAALDTFKHWMDGGFQP
jgi:hypothetical protein